MVIHDMRNPTNSIEYALKEVLKMMQNFGTLVGNVSEQRSGVKRKNSSLRGHRAINRLQEDSQ
jgi:hypothetical protein